MKLMIILKDKQCVHAPLLHNPTVFTLLVHSKCCVFMKYTYLPKDKAVFHIDTKGTKFFLLLQGTVGVYIRLPTDNKQQDNEDDTFEQEETQQSDLVCVKELHEGMGFGELALLSNSPRLSSIICHTNCHLATLDKKEFTEILRAREESKLIQEMGFFASLPIFQGWNFNLIKQLYLKAVRVNFVNGDVVFKEGSAPLAVYIISHGEFAMEKIFVKPQSTSDNPEMQLTLYLTHSKKPTKQLKINVYCNPELFGEEEILSNIEKRRCSAVCNSAEGQLIMIKKEDFNALIMMEEGSQMYMNKRLEIKNYRFKRKVEAIKKQINKFSSYVYSSKKENSQILNLTTSRNNNNSSTADSQGLETLKKIIKWGKSELNVRKLPQTKSSKNNSKPPIKGEQANNSMNSSEYYLLPPQQVVQKQEKSSVIQVNEKFMTAMQQKFISNQKCYSESNALNVDPSSESRDLHYENNHSHSTHSKLPFLLLKSESSRNDQEQAFSAFSSQKSLHDQTPSSHPKFIQSRQSYSSSKGGYTNTNAMDSNLFPSNEAYFQSYPSKNNPSLQNVPSINNSAHTPFKNHSRLKSVEQLSSGDTLSKKRTEEEEDNPIYPMFKSKASKSQPDVLQNIQELESKKTVHKSMLQKYLLLSTSGMKANNSQNNNLTENRSPSPLKKQDIPYLPQISSLNQNIQYESSQISPQKNNDQKEMQLPYTSSFSPHLSHSPLHYSNKTPQSSPKKRPLERTSSHLMIYSENKIDPKEQNSKSNKYAENNDQLPTSKGKKKPAESQVSEMSTQTHKVSATEGPQQLKVISSSSYLSNIIPNIPNKQLPQNLLIQGTSQNPQNNVQMTQSKVSSIIQENLKKMNPGKQDYFPYFKKTNPNLHQKQKSLLNHSPKLSTNLSSLQQQQNSSGGINCESLSNSVNSMPLYSSSPDSPKKRVIYKFQLEFEKNKSQKQNKYLKIAREEKDDPLILQSKPVLYELKNHKLSLKLKDEISQAVNQSSQDEITIPNNADSRTSQKSFPIQIQSQHYQLSASPSKADKQKILNSNRQSNNKQSQSQQKDNENNIEKWNQNIQKQADLAEQFTPWRSQTEIGFKGKKPLKQQPQQSLFTFSDLSGDFSPIKKKRFSNLQNKQDKQSVQINSYNNNISISEEESMHMQ